MFSPEEAARQFGTVSPRNYLAHTIREIEQHILRKKGRHYTIATYMAQRSTSAKCRFFDNGCVIMLPVGRESDHKEIRIRLAHELAHIICNIDRLDTPGIITEGNEDEEIFAWAFAYSLVSLKSRHYANNNYKEFSYSDREIAATIERLVKDKRPQVIKAIAQKVPFPA